MKESSAEDYETDQTLLQVKNLRVEFPIRRGLLRHVTGYVHAVSDVSFSIRHGETLGLVGESGCGKTTTGRSILQIVEPTGGDILYRNQNGTVTNLAQVGRQQMKPYWREIRMIFQDPFSSLNPRLSVLELIGDPLRNYGIARGSELEDRVAELLRRVGLRKEYIRRYPHAFSGGERQRIGIARALAMDPRLIIADEAVSALDVSVQAQILNLLVSVQKEMNLTYLFIAHDLSVVRYISDRVAVMYVGKLVEIALTDELYSQPLHPYTEALLSAVPVPNPKLAQMGKRIRLAGEVPNPADLPSGCYFHPRCPYAKERCRIEAPKLREVSPGRHAACHFAEKLNLRGIAR